MKLKTQGWLDISTAPKDGRRIILYIPYSLEIFSHKQCEDLGEWSQESNCWRFDGDDGPQDIQPIYWKPWPNIYVRRSG